MSIPRRDRYASSRSSRPASPCSLPLSMKCSTNGNSVLLALYGEHLRRRVAPPEAEALWHSSCARRDLPIPGSPLISTTRPPPAPTVSQCSSSSASSPSRPTNGVSPRDATASSRVRASVGRNTRNADTGRRMPLSVSSPMLSTAKKPSTRTRVPSLITTVPGQAADCRRAARFGVSPTISCGCRLASSPASVTTTSPVWTPIRTWRSSRPKRAPRAATASTTASPAATASRASSSCASG